MMILIAQTAPEEILLEGLIKSARAYLADKSSKNKTALEFELHMLNLKFMMQNKTPEELMADFERYKKTKDLLNPKKN